jgi:hypothetical protein
LVLCGLPVVLAGSFFSLLLERGIEPYFGMFQRGFERTIFFLWGTGSLRGWLALRAGYCTSPFRSPSSRRWPLSPHLPVQLVEFQARSLMAMATATGWSLEVRRLYASPRYQGCWVACGHFTRK